MVSNSPIESQQTRVMGDGYVAHIWLEDGTHIRADGTTSDTANLSAAWACRVAAERARRGGELAQPFPIDFTVKFAHPRDVLLAEICDRLDGWPQFAELRRQALVELFGEMSV